MLFLYWKKKCKLVWKILKIPQNALCIQNRFLWQEGMLQKRHSPWQLFYSICFSNRFSGHMLLQCFFLVSTISRVISVVSWSFIISWFSFSTICSRASFTDIFRVTYSACIISCQCGTWQLLDISLSSVYCTSTEVKLCCDRNHL